MNRFAVTACVALGTVGVLAAATSGAHAGGAKASDIFHEKDLVVTLVTPTVNQEVLPDLSDPGLNNVITVRFSSVLNPHDIIDPQNVVNSLAPKVEFFGSSFARLPGVPSVRRNVFTFNPFLTSPVLGQGQYTLNIKSSIRNQRGRMLNSGGPDFTTTFSVGTDVYPPVLRRVAPIDGQINISLNQKLVATFNEPILAGSIINTVQVVNAATNPPTPILGTFSLARGGFDIVFTPDPCFGYPPKTDINMTIQGDNPGRSLVLPLVVNPVATAVTDVFQNKFTKDSGLQWVADPATVGLYHSPNGSYDTVYGVFTLHFQTKGVKPNPVGIAPDTCQNPYFLAFPAAQNGVGYYSPSATGLSGGGLLYSTNNGLGELDLRKAFAAYNQGLEPNFASNMSILPNAPVAIGRPAGMIYDPRVIPPVFSATGAILNPTTAFQTYMYVVNEKTGTVDIIRSDTFKTMGRLAGFQNPRDVGIQTDFQNSKVQLFVSNFGSNELVAVDIAGIKVTAGGQPGAASPCASLQDNLNHRVIIPVGAGPTEVSADSFLNSPDGIMVCNSLDSSVSKINPSQGLITSYEVGSNPVSCDWVSYTFGGAIQFAMVACQGGLDKPDGEVDLYFKGPPGVVGQGYVWQRVATSHDGIEAQFDDGMKNPTHVWGNIQWVTGGGTAYAGNGGLSQEWYVSNTGGNTVKQFTWQVQGLYAQTLAPQFMADITVGPNPSSATPDGYYGIQQFLFTSVLGTGRIVGTNIAPLGTNPSEGILVPGVRRLFTVYTH